MLDVYERFDEVLPEMQREVALRLGAADHGFSIQPRYGHVVLDYSAPGGEPETVRLAVSGAAAPHYETVDWPFLQDIARLRKLAVSLGLTVTICGGAAHTRFWPAEGGVSYYATRREIAVAVQAQFVPRSDFTSTAARQRAGIAGIKTEKRNVFASLDAAEVEAFLRLAGAAMPRAIAIATADIERSAIIATPIGFGQWGTAYPSDCGLHNLDQPVTDFRLWGDDSAAAVAEMAARTAPWVAEWRTQPAYRPRDRHWE